MTARPAPLLPLTRSALVIDFITAAAKAKHASHFDGEPAVITGPPWWFHRFLGGLVWWKDRFYFLPLHQAINEANDDHDAA
jgi:hypothetical protein